MEGNSLKSFENLCKIFEMRIKLDKEKGIDTPEDVLINYEKYAKKIDSIYNNDFEKEIKPLITPEVTLDKEKERLKKLIKLLEDRLSKRDNLENKFYITTGRYIKGLQLVVSESELNENKDRLELISKYLDTKDEIENITESIAKLKDSLLDEENKREEYKSKNKIMEDELYSLFVDVISDDDYFSNVNEDNVNNELVDVLDKVKETKETLDVTKESVNSLMYNGSNDDYSSYVEDAEKGYFVWKNRELLLKIYGLVINLLDDFSDIYDKREKISSLVKKRKNLRESLNITTSDELSSFEKLLSEQMNTLNDEKEIMESISNYTNRINFKEERLNELEEENNSVEVLSILREYGLIDTYDNEEIPANLDLPLDDTLEDNMGGTFNDDSSATIVKETVDPYRIVEIKDYPKSLNVGLAKLKGESVREKVNKKLNPKKEGPTFEEMTAKIDVVDTSLDTSNDSSEEINNDIKTKNTDIKNEIIDSKIENKTPVWEIPSNAAISNPVSIEKTDSIPVWNEIKPITEISEDNKNTKIELDINPQNTFTTTDDNFLNNGDGNMFWVPISDTKLETNKFPNINIPIGNNFASGNDNFGFPNLKNE